MRSALPLGVLTVFLAGCTQVAKTSGPGRGALRVGQLWPFKRLNPVLSEEGFDSEAHYLVFDRLVWRGEDGRVVPGLLANWRSESEGRHFVLTLRPGLRFHDGQPVTADDLMFTIEAIRDPVNDSPYAPDLQIISSIEKLDERAVSIHLKHPSRHFPELLDFGVLPEHLLRGQQLADNPFNQHPVGAGPLRVVRMDAHALELERNPTYYGAPAGVERLTITTYDSDELWRRLLAHHIDAAQFIPWSKERFLGRLQTIRTDASTRLASLAICFNKKHKPFDDPAARRALARAIDRKRIVDQAEFGFGIATQRLAPDEPETQDLDIETARRLLGGRTFHLGVVATNSAQIDVAMNLQRQLSAADITLQIDPGVARGTSDMNFCGSFDPTPLETARYKYGSALNPAYTDIDAIFERIDETQDEPARRALFRRVEDRILADVPRTILFWQTNFSAYRAEYCGYHMVNLFDGLEKMRPCP